MQMFTQQREEPNVIRNEDSDDNYDFAGALDSARDDKRTKGAKMIRSNEKKRQTIGSSGGKTLDLSNLSTD